MVDAENPIDLRHAPSTAPREFCPGDALRPHAPMKQHLDRRKRRQPHAMQAGPGVELPVRRRARGQRNGHGDLTVKTTAGPVALKRPKLCGMAERVASALPGKGVVRAEFDAFRDRDLPNVELDCLFLDASHFKMHHGSRAEPVLVVSGRPAPRRGLLPHAGGLWCVRASITLSVSALSPTAPRGALSEAGRRS